MKISELFTRLSYGELSNLSISNEGSGLIKEASHPKLILYINEGLLRLYTKYVLAEKSVLIEQVSHITNYHLKRKFAETSESQEPFKYIKDLPGDNFIEDVIKILEVYDSFGIKRDLNNSDNLKSLFTPYPDTLQVPLPVQGQGLSVSYQASHKELTYSDSDYTSQEIDLPLSLEGALQGFVAHKVYSHMNGQENKMTSQEMLLTYESICLEVDSKDIVNNSTITNYSKLYDRGFI